MLKKKPGLTIAILAMLFGIPLFTAFFMAKEREPISTHTTNKGTLISPPLDLAGLHMQNEEGKSIDENLWKGKWLMLYINATDQCDAKCAEGLYNLRQIKVATGKNANRVERAIITFSSAPFDEHLQNVLEVDFKGTSHFIVNKNDFLRFVSANASAKKALMENSIFLVDPLGNIMMIYSQQSPAMDIFKDLEKLLKLSRIG